MAAKSRKQVSAVADATAENIVEKTAAAEVANEVPAAAAVAEAPAETAADAAASREITSLCPVVVCAFAGTEEKMQAIWERHYRGDFKVITVAPDASIKDIVAEGIADETVDDIFALVPANTFPCSEIRYEELFLPVVYLYKTGKAVYNHSLPKAIDKAVAVELLADDSLDDETFCRRLSEASTRPVKVGFSFGNFVMPVVRATPCENKVIEGLLCYKYLACSPEGFNAIQPLVDTTILKS